MVAPKPAKGRPFSNLFLRLLFLLWVTLAAFGLPEVIAGTGRLWINNPGTYVLVMPLYALHFLILSHVAIWSKRTSWPALYLFGVIFGLYETWITKVVWSGYPGSDGFAFGGFGSWFGIHETLGLVLFYHPVISFLLPLAVVSRLFPNFGRPFPVPDWVFGKTRTALMRRLALLFMLGAVTGLNNPVPGEYLITWVPMLVLMWLGYVALHRAGVTARSGRGDIARPRLSGFGLAVAVIWLLAIYGVTYLHLQPTSRPPIHIQLITFGFYPILILLIWKAGAMEVPSQTDAQHPTSARMPFFWLLAVFGVGLIGIILNGLGIAVLGGAAVVAFASMVVVGVVLFAWLVIWQIVLRRQTGPA